MRRIAELHGGTAIASSAGVGRGAEFRVRIPLAAPSIAIDLPLKILVAEDEAGKVWISYNSSEYLAERHGLPDNLLQNIAVVKTLAEKAAE